MENSSLKVAVSYSWKEDADGPNAGRVEGFCQRLKTRGIEVVRDREQMRPGESILAFMRSLGASGFLCVFLSDRYLKSPNCMYELLIAWQRSRDNPEEFRRRVKVWVMPGMGDIGDLKCRISYLEYWKQKSTELEPILEKYAKDGLSSGSLDEFQRLREYGSLVDSVLKFISDQLSPRSVDEFAAWVEEIAGLSDARNQKPDERELAEVHAEVVEAIEETLGSAPNVASFLGIQTPRNARFLVEHNGVWKVLEQYRTRIKDVGPILASAEKRLRSFSGVRHEWDALELVLGGIFVLGIDPEWVWRNRRDLSGGALAHPKQADEIPLGRLYEGVKAQFLAVLGAALAGGCARLERMFGRLDSKRVPDLPAVMPGVTSQDRAQEIKRHFIRFLLGPDSDSSVDELNGEALDTQFKRVEGVLRRARHTEHDPVIGAGPRLATLAKEVKENLELSDLCLFVPSESGSEFDLMTDPMPALLSLFEIHKVIKAKRPNI
ncbi:MAG: toll/interleukin-1 receptor domain-containing protein [Verrucomicrobiales bacterium]|nr:toll/interleukin-1 receptor domain-containing protein [Verrucomicrobiales bacterium]